MTLADVKRQAYNTGWQDAMRGRLYRYSYDVGSPLRALQLEEDYEAGWQDGRKRK